MPILDNVKLALRLSGDTFNDELNLQIAACKKDLEIAGVKTVDDTDDFTALAITVFVKSNFCKAKDESDKFRKSYEMMKNQMSIASEYNTEEEA